MAFNKQVVVVFITSLLSYSVLAQNVVLPTTKYPEATHAEKIDSAKVQEEIGRLRTWYENEPGVVKLSKRVTLSKVQETLVRDQLEKNNIVLGSLQAQTLVVVDRSPMLQHAWVVVVNNATLYAVADTPVSTGSRGRFDYYITPTGVFSHTGDIVGYRAEGTKNEHGVRGLGSKGMRVWDFGWQPAQTGWLKKNETRTIRFEMHATDPLLLEPRLGNPASKGCVRVSSGFNRFMDQHGILDGDVLARTDVPGAKSVLSKTMTPTLIPGRYLVVIDSSI